MSYKALYRTYRPEEFNQVVGQNHIVTTLENVVRQGKVSHAYLFAGPRGTGKTSVAHIFARAINQNARQVDQDLTLDIIEIDAASNNGVAEMRSIIENARFAPVQGKYKVYIIDEVHMLSKGAWNALLKTLEEPPRHIVFILATTEPHKIPATILSRTQRFNFKRIEPAVIEKQLSQVFEQEKIDCEPEALKFIAKLANGGLRDALSISDQAAAFGNNSITFEAISQVFGLVSIGKQIELINSIYRGESKVFLLALTGFIENGVDLERLTFSLIEILRDLIVYRKTSDFNLIEYLTLEDVNQLVVDLSFAYQMVDTLIELANQIKFTQLPNQLFELKMLALLKTEPAGVSVPEPVPVQLENKLTAEEETSATGDQLSTQTVAADSQLHDLNFENFSETAPDDPQPTLPAASPVKSRPDWEDSLVIPLSQDEIGGKKLISAEKDKTVEDDLDITELFGLDQSNETEKITLDKPNSYTLEELINLLIISKRDQLQFVKGKWPLLTAYAGQEKYGQPAALLMKSKVISAGEHFVLVSSEEDQLVQTLNLYRQNPIVHQLTQEVFGSARWIYAITREQFEEVKKSWSVMKAEGQLRAGEAISPPQLEVKVDPHEEIGRDIFGDLFGK
ncbi:DNA polymerase III subunit gamma/tau [Mycoplasma sp. ATU-Cv-703]|uniref:DNA polymerase III subunit gamma/tau n=1 Tax=Mycoplasma sp. ATU-Cv-703 TaxID=2498595 RepID=UPI000FDD8849